MGSRWGLWITHGYQHIVSMVCFSHCLEHDKWNSGHTDCTEVAADISKPQQITLKLFAQARAHKTRSVQTKGNTQKVTHFTPLLSFFTCWNQAWKAYQHYTSLERTDINRFLLHLFSDIFCRPLTAAGVRTMQEVTAWYKFKKASRFFEHITLIWPPMCQGFLSTYDRYKCM